MTARRALALLVVALVAAVLVPVLGSPAAGCSCVAARSDADAAAAADVVFVGRVDEIEVANGPFWATADTATWRFVVDQVYKGEVEVYAEVRSASSGASCGVELERGETALVFARFGTHGFVEADDDDLTADLCNGTRVVADVEPDLPVTGYAPVALSEPVGEDAFPLLGWVSLAAVAGLFATSGGLWLRLAGGLRSSRT